MQKTFLRVFIILCKSVKVLICIVCIPDKPLYCEEIMMLFHWIKERKARRAAAEKLYQMAATQSRNPMFYQGMGVSDSFDGRFDVLVLHIYMATERLNELGNPGRQLGQALFYAMFRTMDLTLREMGVGDVGIPKRMQKMMKAFNGRAHVYHEALQTKNFPELQSVIARNVYRSEGDAPPRGSEELTAYAFAVHDYFKTCSYDQFYNATGVFPETDVQEPKRAA